MFQKKIISWVADFWSGNFFDFKEGKKIVPVLFFFLGIVVAQTLVFTFVNQISIFLVLWALPLGLVLGGAIVGLESVLITVRAWIFGRVDRILAGFLLFFPHVIGYIVLSSLLVSYPLGRIIAKMWGGSDPAGEYGLFAANIILILSIISWVRNLFNGSQLVK